MTMLHRDVTWVQDDEDDNDNDNDRLCVLLLQILVVGGLGGEAPLLGLGQDLSV